MVETITWKTAEKAKERSKNAQLGGTKEGSCVRKLSHP
jgi:hypothetical protein